MRHAFMLSACLLPCLAHAATFQSFDVPGASGTCGSAIASNGLVAGNTVEPTTIGTSKTTPTVTPFLYAAGRFSYPKLSLPAGTVGFTGVNRERSITGFDFNFSTTNPVSINFVDHHGTITTPSTGTLPLSGLSGITDRGVILGQATLVTPLGGGFSSFRTIGLLRAADGTVTPIDDGSSFLFPRGMDAKADRVVGFGFAGGSGGWLFSGGIFTAINFPGATYTFPAGVDEAGIISGTYTMSDLAPGSSTVTHGFFLRHGTYTSFDVPVKGATSTNIGAMNEADQITGCYIDIKGYHGFIRTP